jgi:hypothetical protein
MRHHFVLASLVFCLLAVAVATDLPSFNVKEGLWEETVTHSMTGMPSMANIPPDALAKMPPDQRAKVEAMMKGGATTDVHKECVTKEKLQKNMAFSNGRGDCDYTLLNSTGSKVEAKFHCTEKQSSSDGTYKMEAIGSDNVKGTIHIATNSSSGHNMTMDMTITSKYLGPACGDVK